MSSWRPDRLLAALLGWVTFHLVFSWLPLVRCVMDGESYVWGTSHFGVAFGSAGLGSPDVWLLVAKSALFVTLIQLGLRGAGRAFRLLLVAWSLVLVADVGYELVTDPGGFEFHGDTLGVHLNLGWIVGPVVAAFALLAVVWAARQRRSAGTAAPPVWQAANTRRLAVVLLMLPIQFLLLRFGEPHGLGDKIGVLLTIAQCPLYTAALWPRTGPD